MSELLTTDEAAEYLRLQPQTLCVWRSTGAQPLKYVKIGRYVRYRKSDLDEYIASRVVSNTTQAHHKRKDS